MARLLTRADTATRARVARNEGKSHDMEGKRPSRIAKGRDVLKAMKFFKEPPLLYSWDRC